jgi:class 3 adenylate cyclase/tetratricopeptide (TPR) repeat protein
VDSEGELPLSDAKPTTAPLTASGAAQRCHLSLIFCDLCDSTAISSAMEAEEYEDLLTSLRYRYEAAVSRFGGTVVRIQGDGMLAVFGFPKASEGDGRRAAETALELRRTVAEIRVPDRYDAGGPLRVHTGIHAGTVLVKLGDVVSGRLELLGMAPNVTGHLSAEAGPDEILVSEETLGPDRYLFETGVPRLVPLDGHGAVITCLPVLGRAAVTASSFEARARRGLQPFLGRSAEIRQLEGYLEHALAGSSLLVHIAGPAGVGKTRLAEQFLLQSQQDGCRILKGFCDGDLGATPLQPLTHLIRGASGLPVDASPTRSRDALLGTLDDLDLAGLGPQLMPALGLPPEGAETSSSGESTVSALMTFFATIASRQPTLLFVDDWQWADASTRQVLSAIGMSDISAPLMVLCTSRSIDPADATMSGVKVVNLRPFSGEEASASIRTLLPRADPFLADEICRYSGGNPLFIEELCHWAAHDQRTGRSFKQMGAAWLSELVESRLARLPEEEIEIVRTAAVIGNLVPIWLLRELTGLGDDASAMNGLAEKDFLFPEDGATLRFKHGLTRDVIYESVGLHARRALHLRIAEALERRVEPGREQPHEALAYHFGGAGRSAKAARHAEAAADLAAAMSVLDRAKTLYHAALARLDETYPQGATLGSWLAMANKLGLICVFDASRKDLPVFERAVQLAQRQNDPALVARAEYWLGYILYALGESTAAISHCERARAAAGAGDGALAVQIRATLGQVMAASSDYRGALPLLEEAVTIKRQHRRGSRPAVGLAYSLVCLAAVVGDRGDFERAYQCFDEAWQLLNGATHQIGASIQGWRAAVLTWQGRWEDARAAARESAQIAEETRSLFQFCQGQATAAYAEWKLSGEERFIEAAEQATAWLEPRESGLFRSLNHGWMVDGWVGCGQRDRARWHARRVLRRGRTGDLIGAAMAFRALARDAAGVGDRQRAERYLARARQVAERRESAHEHAATELCHAEVLTALDPAADVRSRAAAALESFERMSMHWHAHRARALAGTRSPSV